MDESVKERVKDLVTAALLAVVGIGGFVFINPRGATVNIGPGGLSWQSLPFIYSGLLLVLTAVYALSAVRALMAARRQARPDRAAPDARTSDDDAERLTNRRRAAVALCTLLYALALPRFGFVISTPVLLFVLFRVFGRKDSVRNGITALVGGALLALLFIGVLHLPLQGTTWDPATRALGDLMRMLGR
ncbi:MAG: tripartite tricarboxylate transporter TctB family protein [Burkholderiaceae bacterium]